MIGVELTAKMTRGRREKTMAGRKRKESKMTVQKWQNRKWQKVSEERRQESWGVHLLHLEHIYMDNKYSRPREEHLFIEECADGWYAISYGGPGSSGMLVYSQDRAELEAKFADDETIDRMLSDSHGYVPVTHPGLPDLRPSE